MTSRHKRVWEREVDPRDEVIVLPKSPCTLGPSENIRRVNPNPVPNIRKSVETNKTQHTLDSSIESYFEEEFGKDMGDSTTPPPPPRLPLDVCQCSHREPF